MKRPRNDEYIWLKRLNKSLCTIYTFLAANKRMGRITFDILKPMIEKELGSTSIDIEDFAKIKALIPDAVTFDYVDENEMDLDVVELGQGVESVKQMLVFSYAQGKVKARLPHTIAQQIKDLIKNRTDYFNTALDKFIKDNDDDEGWEVKLEKISIKYIPARMVYDNPMDLMMVKTKQADQDPNSSLIQDFIRYLKQSPDYNNQIVAELDRPEKQASFASVTTDLPEVIMTALNSAFGISTLYSHQAQAIDNILKGDHIIVTTSTSSGKSLIYQIPVLVALLESISTTALYIFPTKALAQDQKRHLLEFIKAFPEDSPLKKITVDTYDGDTDFKLRYGIRENASIIFTNPDTLHTSILRHHDRWSRFLENLRFVVVDELHYYSGIFGTHVSYILRRLRRLCERLYYSPKVQFISCSATIREPGQLMRDMFAIDDNENVKDELYPDSLSVIKEDGAPHGRKHYIIWECPLVSPADGKQKLERIHPLGEAAKMLLELASRHIRTIAFCPVRKTCELLMKSIRSIAKENSDIYSQEVSDKIISYRGGYSVADRRKIENEMFSGNLLGIVATNALELGIDIGSLDAVLMVGFPSSISSFRQQVGRCGRMKQDSLAVVICGANAVDQYYVTNPEAIFDSPDSEVVLDLDNKLLRDTQLVCAYNEFPLVPELDQRYFGSLATEMVVDKSVSESESESAQIYELKVRIAAIECYERSIRGIQENMYAVVDVTNGNNNVIEEIEESRVTFTLYEGGIFLHKGQPFLILEFNNEGRYAKVQKVNVDWITRQRDYTDVDPVDTKAKRLICSTHLRAFVYYGRIKVSSVVFGYFKVNSKDQIIGDAQVESTPHETYNTGFWINIPRSILTTLEEKNLSLAGAIHAAEHIVLSMLPTVSKTSGGDVSTECKAPEKEFSQTQTSRVRPARLVFYNHRMESGNISFAAYRFIEELLSNAANRLDSCQCEWGCPECVAMPFCKERNEVISKIGAQVILRSLVGRPLSYAEIPQGPEPNLPQITIETIVPASD